MKKGRDTETELFIKKGRETLMNLPEHLLGKEILPNHIIKRMGNLATDEILHEYSDDYSDDEMGGNEEDNLLANSSKYKRYHLPPEIQITQSRSPARSGKELENQNIE